MDVMDTFQKFVKDVRLEANLNQEQLGHMLGKTKSAISAWEQGRNRPGYDDLMRMREIAGGRVEIPFLAKLMLSKEKPPEEIDLEGSDDHVQIKRYTLRLSAGLTGFAVDPIQHDELPPIVFRKEWFQRKGLNPQKLLAVKVKGDSMLPGLSPGDTVVIDTEQTDPKDGVVFAVNYEGELTIKRLARDSGSWWLLSDNPDQSRYPRKACHGSECLIIGRIIHKQSEYI